MFSGLTSTDVTATFNAAANTDDFTSENMMLAETVSFLAGVKTATVTYTINSDVVCEELETFTLALTLGGTTASGNAAVLGSPIASTVYIVDCTGNFSLISCN